MYGTESLQFILDYNDTILEPKYSGTAICSGRVPQCGSLRPPTVQTAGRWQHSPLLGIAKKKKGAKAVQSRAMGTPRWPSAQNIYPNRLLYFTLRE